MALSRTGPVRRWLLRGALALGVAATVAASATAVTLAASGVFDYRAGAWTVALRPLPGVTVQANVSGLLRLATSPLGLRLLDGRVRTTQLGTLAFQRDGAALIIRCAPCRLHDARVAWWTATPTCCRCADTSSATRWPRASWPPLPTGRGRAIAHTSDRRPRRSGSIATGCMATCWSGQQPQPPTAAGQVLSTRRW
jgi:hypothetical protein